MARRRKRGSMVRSESMMRRTSKEDLMYSLGGLSPSPDGIDPKSEMLTLSEAKARVKKDRRYLGFTYRSTDPDKQGKIQIFFRYYGSLPNTDPEWSRYTQEDYQGEWSCTDLFRMKDGKYEHRSTRIDISEGGLVAVDQRGLRIWDTNEVPPLSGSCSGSLYVNEQCQSPVNELGFLDMSQRVPMILRAIDSNTLSCEVCSTPTQEGKDPRSCTFRKEYKPPLSRYTTREIRRTMCQRLLGKTRRASSNEGEDPYDVLHPILWGISPKSEFRKKMVQIIDHKYFDQIVLLLIVLNGLALVLDDPMFEDVTELKTVTEVSEITFQTLFTIEALLKILALGFVVHPGSYLRSYPVPFWNRLDFLIVVSGYVAYASDSGNFTVLRLLRCLRPLRTMNRVKELRQLMATLVSALPLALDIFLLFFYLMWSFAILGVQLFSGDMNNRCYLDPSESSKWDLNISDTRLLLETDRDTTYDFSPGVETRPWLIFNYSSACGSGRGCTVDNNGITLNQSCLNLPSAYHRQYLNFDNIFTSMLLTFKLMSLDDWPDELLITQDAYGHHAWIYFFLCTLLGNVFAVNLILAVLSSVYSHERQNKETGPKPIIERLSTATLLAAQVVHPILIIGVPFLIEEEAAEDEDFYEEEEIAAGLGDQDLGKLLKNDKPQEGNNAEGGAQSCLSNSNNVFSNTQKSGGVSGTAPDSDGDETVLSRRSSVSIPTDSGLASARKFALEQNEPGPVDEPGSPAHRKRLLQLRRRQNMSEVGYYSPGTFGNYMFLAAQSLSFKGFILFVTLINIIALAMDHYRIPDDWLHTLNWVNLVCVYIFLLEAIIKLIGLTPELYFFDNYNIFDFVLVLASIPEMVLPDPDGGGSGFSALRGFRLARIFRLAKRWRGLNRILTQISAAVSNVAYLSIIVMLFLFIYSVMGVQLFACEATPQDPDRRCNFENLGASFLTVFGVVTGENWASLMKETMQRKGEISFLYFFTLFLFGNYILLNLFIAILIDSFAIKAGGEDIEDLYSEPDYNKTGIREWFIKHICKCRCCQPQREQSKEDATTSDNNNVGETLEPRGSNMNTTQNNLNLLLSPQSQNLSVPRMDIVVRPEASDAEPEHFQLVVERATDDGNNNLASPREASNGNLHIIDDETNMSIHDDEFEKSSFSRSRSFLSASGIRRGSMEGHSSVTSNYLSTCGGSFSLRKPRERRLSVWSMSGLTKSSVQVQKKAKTIGGKSTLSRKAIVEIPSQPFHELKFAEFQETAGYLDNFISLLKSDRIPLPDDAADCCTPPPSIRQLCFDIVNWKYFEFTVLVIIVVNLAFISMDNPNTEDNEPDLYQILRVGDYVFVSLFTLEMGVKILAWGWCGLFNDKWHTIDFFVVLLSIIGMAVPSLRSFRALRILRLVSSGSPEMKVILSAVLSAMPSIQHVIFVSGMVWFIFAIVGVQLFKGALYECTDPTILREELCFGNVTVEVPTAFGYEYVNSIAEWRPEWFTFDDVFESMFSLFQMSVGEKWRFMMYRTIDAPGQHQGPRHNANYVAAGIFFVIFVVLGQFFFINLFIGVLIQRFAIQKEKSGENTITMTKNQQDWVMAQKMLTRSRLHDGLYPQPAYCQRVTFFKWVHYLACRKEFETVATAVIVLNSITLAMHSHNEGEDMTDFLFVSNWFFVIIFTLEALVKLIAFSYEYFSDGWNRFDFLIVAVSWVSTISQSASTSGIRVLRVGRILRLLGRAEGLKTIVATLMSALPSLMNISTLLLVVYFIFGVFGVDMFGRMPVTTPFGHWTNFDNLYRALVTLYVVSTTESWNDIMRATMTSAPNCEESTFHCGVSTSVARAYFVLFLLVGCFVFLNLFIYVLIEHFEDEKDGRNLRERTKDLEVFDILKREWLIEDRLGTGVCDAEVVIRILQRLPEPLWLSSPFSMSAIVGFGKTSEFLCTQKQLRSMLIPLDVNHKVLYLDLVRTLSLKIFNIDIQQAIKESSLRKHRFRSHRFDPSFWTIHHYHAVQYVIHKWSMFRNERLYVAYEQSRCPIRKAVKDIRERLNQKTQEEDHYLTARKVWVSEIVNDFVVPQVDTSVYNNTPYPEQELNLGKLSNSLSSKLSALPTFELEDRVDLFRNIEPFGNYVMLPGGAYSGELEQFEPNGYGTMSYPDGYHEGNWCSGVEHGEGLFRQGSTVLKGTWKNGKARGYCALGNADEGYVFIGRFMDGVPQGKGTIEYFNGTSVTAHFNGSTTPTGIGTIVLQDSDEPLTGTFINAVPHSYIVDNRFTSKTHIRYVTSCGDVYTLQHTEPTGLSGKGNATVTSIQPHQHCEGDFKDGLLVSGRKRFAGKGSEIAEEGAFSEGRLVVGTMTMDRIEFTGTFTWKDGDIIFKGPTNKAILRSPTDRSVISLRWEGEFDDWLLHGKGVKDYLNGNHISGRFSEGELAGFSCIDYPSGVRCEGHFIRTTAHGWAKITYSCFPEYEEEMPISPSRKHKKKGTEIVNIGDGVKMQYLEHVPRPSPLCSGQNGKEAPVVVIGHKKKLEFVRPPSNPLIGVFHMGLLWKGPTANGCVPHGVGTAYLQSGVYFVGEAHAGRIRKGDLFAPDGTKLEGKLKFGCLLEKDHEVTRLF
eukprot:TRINITY_DN2170_c0_g1_i9.p1 TRINITY_DN2170_c0_g1~~TRINITY_DN2170_c0_g1_i9.p1  ORF type:complete len:2591 (+),score=361.48 TRINITY_DN2170_c0_g1_i9:114-7886(+)